LQNQWLTLVLAADKDIIDYLYNIRSQMFAKALPMIQTIGSLKRLELLRNHPELKDKLWENECITKWIEAETLILEIQYLCYASLS
jgi:7-keto-8-aminopelargonate synthetase-like enzyme